MKDGAGMDEAAGMDPQDAAVILQEARARAERELNYPPPGDIRFLGTGLPARLRRGLVVGPWPAALSGASGLGASAAGAARRDRPWCHRDGDRPGDQRRRRRVRAEAAHLLAVYCHRIAGLYIMEAALRYNDVSRAVLGVVTASAPLLVAGVVLVAGTAAWLNWYAFGLGVWLIAVAAFSGFAGPVGVWAVDALAVGIPFLLIAAIRIGRSWS